MATGFVNGTGAIFNPHRIHTPSPITKKFVTNDYVGDLYGCAKFCANLSTGGFWANWWNITKIYLFIYTFYVNSPTGQTCRQIFTLDDSNNADSRKGVPFGGFVDITPHFGGEIPPSNPNFLRPWIGVFKPNMKNIESFILPKLLHRLQPNFA